MEVCPDSNSENVRKYLPYILKAMVGANMLSANQLIAVISTIYVETTPFAPIKEDGGDSKPYAPFFGRGFVQLTHESNYESASKALDIPGLVENPDLALEPERAARILAWFWVGGAGNADIRPYAERGDFDNCRSIINAGSPGRIRICHSVPQYRAAIARAIKVFTQPLDPAAIGALPLDGTYGTGCIDAGSGLARTLSGGHNPTTQADALMLALGLHARDRQNGYRFKAQVNVASQPEVLRLDVQKTFEAKGFGEKLDGEFTVEEALFYPLAPGGIQLEVNATKPDPDAPPPQIFVGDTTQGLSAPSPQQLATPADAADISARIAQAAIAARGRSSASGPDGGNLACAWAVNLFCILPAGLKNIGFILGGDGVSESCRDMIDALEKGRGQRVSRDNAPPGAIWFAPNKHHVGIYLKPNVISNSSSRAAFVWEDDIDDVNNSGYYGSGPEYGLFLVLN